MKRTEIVELTVVCLLRRGEQILLQNRTKKDWQGYTLPGGHVEPGESIVDAVVREMREEIGKYSTVPDFSELLQVMESDRLSEFLYIPDSDTWQVVLR